jgi:hypothetical protein
MPSKAKKAEENDEKHGLAHSQLHATQPATMGHGHAGEMWLVFNQAFSRCLACL